MSEDIIEECLAAHNRYRDLHGTPPLSWDTRCAKTAQIIALKLAAMDYVEYGCDPCMGQNIAVAAEGLTISRAVDLWYDECNEADFNFDHPKFNVKTRCFSQIVWAATTHVGCGVAVSDSGTTYFVAHYKPPGNAPNKFYLNVPPPGNIRDGLIGAKRDKRTDSSRSLKDGSVSSYAFPEDAKKFGTKQQQQNDDKIGSVPILHNLTSFRYRMRQLFFPGAHQIAKYENAKHYMRQPSLQLSKNEAESLPFEWFEACIVGIIICNTFTLAFEMSDDGFYNVLIERIFLIVFAAESVIRMICFGIWGRTIAESLVPPPYFRDPWNCFDFIIVLAGVIDMFASQIKLEGISVLRTVRVLRPLKSASKFPSVRMLVNSILLSLPKLRDVSFLLLLFFISFGVVGLQSFMGGFRRRCVHMDWFNDTTQPMTDFMCNTSVCGVEITVCKNDTEFKDVNVPPFYCPYEYRCLDYMNPKNDEVGFDNIGQAILILISIVSLDQWSPIMYWAMQYTHFFSSLYFVLVVIIGAFFIINLTVVVITISIEDNKKSEESKLAILQSESLVDVLSRFIQPSIEKYKNQIDFVMARFRKLQEAVAASPTITRFRTFVREKIVNTDWFNFSVGVAIPVNVIIFSLDHWGMPKQLELFLYWSNIVFTLFFTVEVVLRVLAVGRQYFTDKLNVFDAFIVSVSFIDIFFQSTKNLASLRVVRVATRVLKFAHMFPSLARWIQIVMWSIPSTSVVLVLIFMLMFVFSCLCKDLIGPTYTVDGVKPRMNFDDIWNAMLISFQIITGEDWSDIIINVMVSHHRIMAVPIILFFFVSKYLMLNLFVAVLLSTRDDLDNMESEKAEVRTPKAPEQLSLEVPDSLSYLHPPPFDLDPQPEALLHMLRRKATEIATHRYFEIVVTLAIIGASVCMSLEKPMKAPDTLTSRTLAKFDTLATCVFAFEVGAKIFGYGFFAYLKKTPWNLFDFFIIASSTIGLVLESTTGYRNIRYVKVLRSLRPLRFIRRVRGLNVVFDALVSSIPGLLNILIMCILLWFIWGLTGVTLFKGKFYSCNYQPDVLLTKISCLQSNPGMENVTNFDVIDISPQQSLGKLSKQFRQHW